MALKLRLEVPKLTNLETIPQIIAGIQFMQGPQWLIDLLIKVKSLNPESPYRVFFSDMRLNRSRSQNNYLWGVVYKVISDATGHTSEELHELFKQEYGIKTAVMFGGTSREYYKSTSAYDTKEMTDYIDKLRLWAAEQGLHVPQPNEIPDDLYIDYLYR